jgi:hypothetical protein
MSDLSEKDFSVILGDHDEPAITVEQASSMVTEIRRRRAEQAAGCGVADRLSVPVLSDEDRDRLLVLLDSISDEDGIPVIDISPAALESALAALERLLTATRKP